MIMRELKILLLIPLDILMLILSIIHSILAFMSVLILKAQTGLHHLYKQIIRVEDNENTQEL